MATGLLDSLPAEQRRLLSVALRGADLAAVATLSDRRDFSGEEWLFERKLDGVRVLAVRAGDRISLPSRTGRRLDDTYPEVVDALGGQGCSDFSVDGEMVAFSRGRTDFARLQQPMGLTRRQDIEASGVAVTITPVRGITPVAAAVLPRSSCRCLSAGCPSAG